MASEIPYSYPKIKGIPQPRFHFMINGRELHFSPDFVGTKGFYEYWLRLTGKEFPPPEEWPDDEI